MDQSILDFLTSDVGKRVGTVLAVAIIFVSVQLYLTHPRRKERAMARKQERQLVGQILSDALEDACLAHKITKKQWHKYNKKLGTALGLSDMIPMLPTARLWSSRYVDLNKVKALSRIRLTAMGVNIAEGLKKIRRNKTTKRDRLLAKLREKHRKEN